MQAIDPIFDPVPFDRARDPRPSLMWLLPWGVALAFGAGMEAWVAHARPAAAPQFAMLRPAAAAPIAERMLANPYGGLVDFLADAGPAAPRPDFPLRASLDDAAPAVAAAENGPSPYGGLVDLFPDFLPGAPGAEPAALASLKAAPPAAAPIPAPPDVPLPPKRDVARIDDAAPLPPARPTEFASLTPAVEPDRRAPRVAETPAPAADDRNLFQRLFATGRPSSAAVAAATPESGARGAAADRTSGFSIFARSAPPPGYDQWTAVYDISARTVYLPDGTRLEAHSGLGDRLDDPRYVNERMRGATPPALYELGPREEPFHGVLALRLTPIGDGDVYGRAGLLAHSYMLGPNGDSNGCVSFKDYDAFLHAFQQGQVKRLAVVARLD
ncbi:MAG: DUF2778 domain-containing protein [Roseiarcus sp.]|jgi:hypothetical protein